MEGLHRIFTARETSYGRLKSVFYRVKVGMQGEQASHSFFGGRFPKNCKAGDPEHSGTTRMPSSQGLGSAVVNLKILGMGNTYLQ
jgi:hypothetical protein